MSAFFKNVVASMKETKNIDRILVGTAHLGEGSHDVVVASIDPTRLEENILRFTFTNAEDLAFTDNVFVLDRDGRQLGFQFRRILSGLLPDQKTLAAFMDVLGTDDNFVSVLTGMKVNITLAPGKGFQVRVDAAGKFVAHDTETNEALTEAYDDVKTASIAAEGLGYKRAFMRIAEVKVIAKEDNLNAFNTAIAAREKASAAGGVLRADFATGTGGAKSL